MVGTVSFAQKVDANECKLHQISINFLMVKRKGQQPFLRRPQLATIQALT